MKTMLEPIRSFLSCMTPQAWIDYGVDHIDLLLIDHAHCEKKAASTALNLMYRYVDRETLLFRLSRLAREELRHFEQVLKLLQARNIPYTHLSPSRYAGGLRKGVRTTEPGRLVDLLIIGAIIEARSCERFAAIAPHLDPELTVFYQSLLRSEARHFEHYLALAQDYAGEPIDTRVAFFLAQDRQLIETPDTEFRFHSGIPTA